MAEEAVVANNPASQMLEDVKHFFDIPLRVSIRLGGRKMKVREILQLKQNSIVELPKSAGENVDVLINGRPAAHGEVIELEAGTGIRLTSILAEPWGGA
jgi:flagellar motor switch protein FliN